MDNFKTYREFLIYVKSNYDEEEIITIENFTSYYINEYRNCGKYNCKYTYDDDLKNDTTGELHRLGLIGFEFEKKRHDERENNIKKKILDEQEHKKSLEKSKKNQLLFFK